MTTYLVRLSGKNFLMDGDGGPIKKRFIATRGDRDVGDLLTYLEFETT